MEYRNLGSSGLLVSVVGLGTNQIGNRVDEAGTVDIVNKAMDLGITFIDAADTYGRGVCEELIGKAVKPHRRNMIVATKCSQAMGEGPYWSGNSRKYIFEAVDACLRRLDTDYIDLLQMHRFDPRTPAEETLRALDDLVRSGKVRYIGSSTFTGWQAVESEWVSRTEHLEHYVSAQNQYNMLQRDVERDLVPVCEKYNIGIIPFSPIAGGFLTGKYRRNEPMPEGARLSRGGPGAARTLTDRNYDMLEKLDTFAHERGHSMLELAMSWLASQPAVSTVIAGVTRPEQLEENARACEWHLRPEDLKEIDEIMGVA